MRNPAPLPLPIIDSTIHASARSAARLLITGLITNATGFLSVQEHVELMTVVRDYCNSDLANVEGLAVGAGESAHAAG
jgi:hypothetical protein